MIAPALMTVVAIGVARAVLGRRLRRLVVQLAVPAAVAGAIASVLLSTGLDPVWQPLRAELDRVPPPSSATLTGTVEAGNFLCFDYCPSVYRTYSVDAPAQATFTDLVTTLGRAGFHVDAGFVEETREGGFAARRRFRLVTVYGRVTSPTSRPRTVVELEATW